MTEVLLIEPPSTNRFGNLRTLGSIGTFKADMAWPPLDLMIIAGYLRKKGMSSQILDSNTLKLDFNDIKKFIQEKNPRSVIFTTSTPTIYHDLKTADIAKSVSTEINTIAIGTHVMAVPEGTLNSCENLDAAVTSEAEQVVLNLIKSGYNFSNCPGIAYRKNGMVIKNQPQPECNNLDEFTFPAHDMVPLDKYHDPFTRERPMTVTFTSRGCVNQPPCIMCSACFYGKERYRNPDTIIQELKWIQDIGVKEIRFPFESGFNNLNLAKELFNKMIENNIRLKFTCNGRADRLTPELLKLMKQAGCIAVNIGCESADPKVLEFSKKRVNTDLVREAVSNVKKSGLESLVYFVFGLPFETKNSMLKTLEFTKSLKADMVTFGIAIPHPGTEFYNYLEKNNFLITKDWNKYDPMFKPPYNYPYLSGSDIYKYTKYAYKSYYLRIGFFIKRAIRIDSFQKFLNDFKIFIGFIKRYVILSPKNKFMKSNGIEFSTQYAYFDKADKKRFFWQTQNQYIKNTELKLISDIQIEKGNPILEVGCGEGANIYNLKRKESMIVGIDFSLQKVKMAAFHNSNAKFFCGDATALPFSDNLFELVYCRDILHHIDNQNRVIEEMIRVCKPNKKIIILEANGENLFWRVFGTIIRQERGVKELTYKNILKIIENHRNKLLKFHIDYANMSMFFRQLAHYKFGFKTIGNCNWFLELTKQISDRGYVNVKKNKWPYLKIDMIKK